MEAQQQRDVVFISHATPGDNAFSIWLASRLALAGYNVWCDQEKLLGGEDFWKDIERVIRNQAAKMILVVSKNAFDAERLLRDGIAKEVALADIMKKSLSDQYFLVPVRIDQTSFSNFPIDFIRLNGIDCQQNWADGLHRIIKVLERDDVARSRAPHPSIAGWRDVHQELSKTISSVREKLQTNWLAVTAVPETLRFYEVQRELKQNELRSIASECALPCFDHGRLLVSFADLTELQTALGPSVPISSRGTLKTDDFLIGETGDILGIAPRDAKNKISSLFRQAWDNTLRAKGLTPYEMANQKLAWWFPEGLVEDEQLRYTDFNGKPRKRAVRGTRGKKDGPDDTVIPRYYWHLGFTAKPYSTEVPYIAIQPRIIISEDGQTPLANKTRLNSVRRSVTSMWFNERWRGLILGFANWLADSGDEIKLAVSASEAIRLRKVPMTFDADFGITADPVNLETDDEELASFEASETHERLNDPAFRSLDEDEDNDVDG
ncbi:toll/interleukin-1 receptor domain-containing protein [Roseibium album]|uniref:TIR domain-containing protein n=1 Tax=Roseibium album TaxID=311410 RepID=A0A0M6ZG43_9HYPH|nr:toll/interleukin-1 receptor domain-containing protein [Roseibium album]CTQ60464.1 hypothetical protein LA5094_03239 [Roseibium album]CTQ66051.1 hypothetical protein LA5095_00730 [Roseibium album]CTQ73979.1 hypothetical protein LA5096_03870 [Roseibium album]